MHINQDYLIVDIVDESGKIINEYDKAGDVIITSLISYDMPLVKYYLGDRAKKIKNNCSCGCKSDLIEFEKIRPNEKLKNTNYSGSNIFRRVMRGIYFHDNFNDIKDIKIIQDDNYHLSVYVNKENKNDKVFEERFIARTKTVVPEINKFKMKFNYEFPEFNEQYTFKEIIFKCII